MVTKKILVGSAAVGVSIVSLLLYLSTIPGVSIQASEDIRCAGTPVDPCVSYFNITSTNYTLKFYNSTSRLSFSPQIKNYTIYRFVNSRWREVAFPINMTKGILYRFKLVGYKVNPSDTVKWGVRSGDVEIDPYWLGTETVTYAPASETHCNEGKCWIALYSGNRFVYEDNVWKKVEDAKSLKSAYQKVYLEKDKDFDIDVLDVNYTSLELNLTFNSSNWQDYPECADSKTNDIKCDFKLTVKEDVWNGTDFNKVETKFQYKYQEKNGVKVDLKYTQKGNPLNKEYTFGGNSTTIKLQTANTENLEDTQVKSTAPTTNYGSDTALRIIQGGEFIPRYSVYIKFNISSIPLGQTIDNATLYLYAYAVYDANLNILIKQVSNQTWTEETITYNDKPSTGSIINETYVNTYNQWWSWSGTPWVSNQYGLGNSNISFYLYNDTNVLTGYYFYSKEYATDTTLRPYLNITYSAAGDTTAPTFSSYNANTTIANVPVNFSLVITDEIGLSGYIFETNNTGTWVNTTWFNVTGNSTYTAQNITTLNSTIGAVVNISFYANDTSNNWGVYRASLTTTSDIIAPTFNNCHQNITNNTAVNTNTPILLGCQWNDNVALSMYVNSSKINNSGSWINGTWQSFVIGGWSNFTIIFPSETGSNITVKIYANDSSNNQNITGNWFWYNVTPSDTISPTYSLNSTNSTTAGTPIKHSLNWTDNFGLSGYIFQFCNGTWNGTDCLMITAGQGIYNFSTTSITSVHTVPLNNNKFVDVYCDDTADDISFQIYDTNGTNTTEEIDVDTSAGSCDYTSVGVSAFNSTTFVIGWFDDGTWVAAFAVYNSSGALKSGPTIVDGDTGPSKSVQVSTFNSTHFVIGWFDDTGETIKFAVYDSSSNLRAGPTIVQATGASFSVSVSTFNSTDFVIGWYNNTDSHSYFAIYNSAGTLKVNPTSVAIGTSVSVSVSTFNSTHFVIGWYDSVYNDVTFSVYDSSGNLISGPIDADNSAINSYSVQVSTLNSTNFVISWYDGTDYDLSYAIYDSAGISIVALTDIESWPTAANTPFKYQSPTSQEVGSGLALCNQNWVIAYANTTTQANWKSYKPDGTTWNGICEPIINWVNDTWISMTGTGNWSNVTKTVNSTVGANIAWCVYANDTSNNWNGTSCITPFSYLTTSASTCIYSGSGDWNVNCAEGCTISANTNIGANTIKFTGTGTITVNAGVVAHRKEQYTGCTVYEIEGTRIQII